MSSRRQSLVLLSVFAALALMLSVVGVYAVLSFTVSQHTSEIGIRMALGASASNVLTMMVRKGLLPVLVGLTVGIAAALRVCSGALADAVRGPSLGSPDADKRRAAAAGGRIRRRPRASPPRTRVDPLIAIRCD